MSPSQPTALPKRTPTPWRVETCYGAVALVDERGIVVAHFREPNATANALKVASLVAENKRLREALGAILTSYIARDPDISGWPEIKAARAALAKEDV